MKTYLKWATLAMVLIAPAGVCAADSVGGPIGNHQEAQQEPQRILDPVEFFDKTTGKVKVWYWRAESGYEFYDAPGFHPRTGQALTGVTSDVVIEWQQSQKNAKQCYIIQRDARAPVIYRDNRPGIDPETGRECRLVTTGLIERLKEYAEGKRPGKIKARPPEFFDPRTSEPIVWYVDHGGAIEFFDLLGFHPETSEELLPVTPEIVDRWKAQQAQASKKPPAPVDPDTHPFFDLKTGRPNIWHSPGENGALEFFDGPGFHPRTGNALTEITRDFADKRLRERADRLAREEKERADLLQRQEKERADREYSKQNAPQCYIIQRGARAPVIYRDNRPGIDPETGRECRLVTTGLIERLKEYAEGKRPGKIKARPPEFFDPRTSEPIVWYVDHGGAIEIFDLLGYHPETGEELLPVTPEIVDRWKAQQAQASKKPPAPVDPDTYPFFDLKTGRPNIWHSPGENGALEFFDGPGFHPRTGNALTEITRDFADKRLRERADRLAREQKEREDRIAREQKERDEREAREQKERDDRIALEQKERDEREERQEQQRRKELAKQSAAACDALAANPNDQRRRSKSVGVSYDQLKTQIPEAIRACELAVQLLPGDLTLQYQLARAVELVDPSTGQSMQDRLVKKGYPAAFDNAGSLLLHDRGCKQHCVNEAVKLFKKGADLGDPDSMMSLADQIHNGQAKGNMIALYQRAAKLGHPGAIRALEALAQERTPPPLILRFPF